MRNWIICVLIAAATCAVYSSVRRFDFVHLDDQDYIYSNPHVQDGLTAKSIRWAFTTNDVGNYHPITWFSWLTDISLFGVNPRAFHLENVLLHLVDALLLFGVLKYSTGDHWPAAFAAFVFALHPTHVESVAWISERKDVLSTLFLLASILFYLRYARGGGRNFYMLALGSFALSLLSKQMGVTLPVILLLFDFWPLRRGSVGLKKLIVEKIPLVMLSIAASVAIFAVQHAAGEMATTQVLPIQVRLQCVPVAYVRYIFNTIWPTHLCAFYPYQPGYAAVEVVGCTLLLLAVTIICVRLRSGQPWLIVGWSWFVVMMLPVIGIVQVGSSAIADRYLYVPSVGLSIMVAWSAKAAMQHSNLLRRAAVPAAILILCILGLVAEQQVGYWQNTRTLFTQAIITMNKGADAEIQLARFYLTENDPAAAIDHYQQALVLSPHNARVENNLAIAWIRLGRNDRAAAAFRSAVADDPGFAEAHLNFAKLLESIGSFEAAAAEYRMVLKIDATNDAAKSGVARANAMGH